YDQKAAVVDRCWSSTSESLMEPFVGQHGKVIDGEGNCPFVLASPIVGLLEKGRSEDAESQIPEACGDFQRAGARRKRIVQLTEQRMAVRHEGADLATPAVVVQPFGEGLSLAEAFQQVSNFSELV